MKRDLKSFEKKRMTFIGIFERYGQKTNFNGYPEKTILLRDIKLNDIYGRTISDHCWFNFTKQFESLGKLEQGDAIQFDARVKEYIKGWHGRKAEEYGEERYEKDYKLNFPTKIKKLTK